jgi:hypothetical protein
MRREQLSKNVRSWLNERYETLEPMANVGKRHNGGCSDPSQPKETVPVETRSCTKEVQEADEVELDQEVLDKVKEGTMRRLLELMQKSSLDIE